MSVTTTRRTIPALTASLLALLLAAVLLPLSAAAPAGAAACNTATGPYQRQVEAHLKLPVDGRSSLSDCRAIQRWQGVFGISPTGYAGPQTYAAVKRLQLWATRTAQCGGHAAQGRAVCVDLTSQAMWLVEGGKRTWGPYLIRSGRDGYETRTTAGRGPECRTASSRGPRNYCRVYWKDIDHVSGQYGSPMPYSMFWDQGQAFHISDRYLFEEPGSHGCVHVPARAIKVLWEKVPVGTMVFVYGRKPGT
ncbi:L,D-transpeptidase family protein [Vallicoccus soli]|uniref:Murein L,D-transpeptidase n=1 Tax=Vallicoccus soli TaxID=2339232 RepID=A0A3A3Z6Q9_9ACTN|nr:L,D-transpeptidase family protein [Vallicoccus soli]RJK96395.1 murein L,D-transpeptidase [Vallicoccus soli]